MAGLVLKLSPKKRVLLNGAVIENGERRSKFSIITPAAKILRLRDAIRPEDANTPVARLCYDLQLVLTGDVQADLAGQTMLLQLEELAQIFTDPDSVNKLDLATGFLVNGNFYQCLRALRAILPFEKRLLAMGGEA